MASIPGTYRYEPLSSARDTRLLCLNPGRDDNILTGSLRRISLDVDPCTYEALSYEWGDPTRKHSIDIQGEGAVPITESLARALIDLRNEVGEARLLWVDGLCINQDDITERQQQVAMMTDIYCKAVRVISYIGPETNESAAAISFARYLRAYATSRTGTPDLRLHSYHQLASLGLPTMNDPRWLSFKALMLRAWVCQPTV